jgi:hypothetical protein
VVGRLPTIGEIVEDTLGGAVRQDLWGGGKIWGVVMAWLTYLKERACGKVCWFTPLVDEPPVFETMCVDDKQNFGRGTLLQKGYSMRKIASGLVQVVVMAAGIRSRGAVEGTLQEHNLRGPGSESAPTVWTGRGPLTESSLPA